VIAKEHEAIVAEPDGFKQSIAIPESPVGKGNGRLIQADEVSVEYAVAVFCHSVSVASGSNMCKVLQKEKVNLLIIN
jgi:hypothetical protein